MLFLERDEEIPALVRVTQCVQEWFTVESVRIVYGNAFLRQLLKENDFASPNLPEDDDIEKNEIPDEISPEVRARYIRLCRQLDLLEIQVSQLSLWFFATIELYFGSLVHNLCSSSSSI